MPEYLHRFWKCQRKSILVWITIILISVDLGSSRATPRIFSGSVITDEYGNINIRDSTTLTLTCEGDEPITWKTHQRQVDRSEISDLKGGIESNKHQSTLTVTHTVYTDTGLYVCHYKDSVESTLPDHKAEIYVFVEDDYHILLPNSDGSSSSIQNISTYQNMETIVPCLPTSRHVSVTLWKGDNDNARQLDLTFDPSRGFIIHSVTDFYSGQIYCIATLRSVTERRDFFVTLIRKIDIPSNIEKSTSSAPIMKTTNLNGTEYKVLAERRFQFRCVGHGVPQPVVKWYRIESGIEKPIDDAGIQILDNGTTLDIARAMFKDSGLYLCDVRNSAGFIRANATLNVIDVILRPYSNPQNTVVIVSVFVVIIAITLIAAGIFLGRRIIEKINSPLR